MTYLRGDSPRPESCVFCYKIEADDDDELIVYRAQHVYVTLNLYPYNSGHLLVIPYEHAADLSAYSPAVLADLMEQVQNGIAALRTVYQPAGFNVGLNLGQAAGAGIAEHVHMHVVPRWPGDGNFMTTISKTRIIPDLLPDTCRQLRAAWPGSPPSD